MSRLPIYHDDLSFHDRGRRTFDDMRRQMESGMHSPFARTWDDEFDRMCGDFYHLRPADPISKLKQKEAGFGSREVLNDNKAVFKEDPATKSRRFEMSFDVKDYDPKEINVKVNEDTLVVEAKHEGEKEGTKTSSQFSRKVEIPKEVDSSRLTSTLSNDGILTVTAPVPPKYNAVASPPAQESSTSPQFGGRPDASPSVMMGRSSPISPGGRSSPLFTNRVYISPSAGQPQRTASPLTHASPPMPPPEYDQFRKSAGSPVKVVQAKQTPPLDEPTFYNTKRGCELVLMVDIGKPYTPEDIKVKVDGLTISVIAEHSEKQGAKTSKCSMSRDFEINQPIDADSVTASLKAGILEINALAKA